MSKSLHTAAPWKAIRGHDGDPHRCCVVQDAEKNFLIAVIENGAPDDNLETELTNANLIAAAPNLLAACESVCEARAFANKTLGDNPSATIEEAVAVWETAQIKLEAAIAKSKGETT